MTFFNFFKKSAVCCEDFTQPVKILGPEDLRSIGRRLSQAVAAGILQEPDTGDPYQDRVSDIAAGNWNDLVYCKFICPKCGNTFKLSCETYHGSGGTFSRVD